MVELKPCPFCGEQPKQSSCMAPELVRCVSDERPHCPASFGGVSVETWNRRQPQSAEWVPWKEGDPLPPAGEYVVLFKWPENKRTHPGFMRVMGPNDPAFADALCWEKQFVIAYLPQPLPDPYTDAQGKRDE